MLSSDKGPDSHDNRTPSLNADPCTSWFSGVNEQSVVTEPPDRNFVFKEIVKIITTIKLHLLNIHLSSTFCQEMGVECKTLLFIAEECWLAERNVLLGAVKSGMGHFFMILIISINTISIISNAKCISAISSIILTILNSLQEK